MLRLLPFLPSLSFPFLPSLSFPFLLSLSFPFLLSLSLSFPFLPSLSFPVLLSLSFPFLPSLSFPVLFERLSKMLPSCVPYALLQLHLVSLLRSRQRYGPTQPPLPLALLSIEPLRLPPFPVPPLQLCISVEQDCLWLKHLASSRPLLLPSIVPPLQQGCEPLLLLLRERLSRM